MKIYYQIFAKIYGWMAQKMCLECSDFIKKGSKILDLGCGSGIMGKAFEEFFQAEITGIDIIDNRINSIPFALYDGKNLPFPDNSFDVVLLSYVMHHCKDPISVLKEAKRVTRDKIVIYEDLAENTISKLICKFHGVTFARFFQKNKEKGQFKSEAQWKYIFNNSNLKLIFEKKVFSIPIFSLRKLFVLEKTPQ